VEVSKSRRSAISATTLSKVFIFIILLNFILE
jgi:hypothetical protein